jgi:hypothetical protein
LISPILTVPVNIVRDDWGKNTASPSSVKISRPAGIPANAAYWDVYVANSAQYGTIQTSDMLRVASKLDLATVDFVDDGTLSIDLGAPAPTVNNTDGMRVDHGVIEDGNPILFGDVDNEQNIWIGGGGPYALDFSTANGGYRAEPEKGTNFSPTAVIGFRNGQGIPSLTVLYSNTEGLSKQAVLEQQNVNYGGQSFTVWGIQEQHYGAAGVAATDSAINYNGKLLFLSTDGFMSMNTQPLRQNVIATDPISVQAIDAYVRQIKNSAMKNVVGAGWNNKYMWTVPSAGFDTPQQILVEEAARVVKVKIGDQTLSADSPDFAKALPAAIKAHGYPASADPAEINQVMTVVMLWLLVVYVTLVYAPIAAWLVELFPSRIRYSGLSLPYHIGNGWFGGFLPATVFAIVAATGNIYSGLWYPIVIAAMSFVVGLIFLPETKDRDITLM